MITTSPLHLFHRVFNFVFIFIVAMLTAPSTALARPVIVAVIDTGADINHPSLNNHLWRNSGELGYDSHGHSKSNNGIDDDSNGFIDDVNGWNFSDNNKNVQDDQGHGTHIAGIISGAQPAQVMVLKAFDAHHNGPEVLEATINAIHYAIKMGAQIINYSGGGTQPSLAEKNALMEAAKSGILVVAAAGNEKSDADHFGFYPAAYNLPNILSVAAVDQTGSLLPSSNYGVNTVKLAAPGLQVISSLPKNQFGAMTGTSQATALVTRTAVLVYDHQNSLSTISRTPTAVIDRIISTADHVPELEGKIHNPVVLNTLRALHASLN